MQHCTVCGSELPDDARFCGKCGHVLSTIDTIDQEPTRTLDETSSATNRDDSLAEEGLAQDDLAAVDTHLLTPYESNGHKPPVVSPPIAHTPAPKARRGSAKRWFIIALVILLIAGGSAAALVFLLHLPVPGIGGTSGVVTSPTSSTNVTPVNTVCPASSASCNTPTTTGPTPTVSGTASTSTVNMTFSGAVTGDMTVSNVARCGPSSSGSEYDIYVSGTVGSTPYTFVSRLTSYTGTATYNTGQIFVVFSQQPSSPTTIWGNSGNLPARAIVNGDAKSGTMEIDLSGSANTVHVSASWICV